MLLRIPYGVEQVMGVIYHPPSQWVPRSTPLRADRYLGGPAWGLISELKLQAAVPMIPACDMSGSMINKLAITGAGQPSLTLYTLGLPSE
jgi:hypothetical protein